VTSAALCGGSMAEAIVWELPKCIAIGRQSALYGIAGGGTRYLPAQEPDR
jgi:hypothetical protein